MQAERCGDSAILAIKQQLAEVLCKQLNLEHGVPVIDDRGVTNLAIIHGLALYIRRCNHWASAAIASRSRFSSTDSTASGNWNCSSGNRIG